MSNNFYMRADFDDFNDLVNALHQWKIDIRQLENSKINDTLSQLKINDIYLAKSEFTGKTHQVGQIPPGRTFVFHRGETSKLLWRKKDIPLNCLLIFPIGSELDVVTKGSINTPHSISLPEDILFDRLTSEQKTIYKHIVSTQDLILIPEIEMENLYIVYDKYFQSLEEDTELINMRNFQKCFEEEIISALITAFFSKEDGDYSYLMSRSSAIWEEIEKYIERYKHRAIMVSELSQAVNISERSLYRLFNERFGITPKAYLNKLRLNGVRADLKKSFNNDIKISDIANNWGFWHMGQFASDYKQLFNELPSKTLHSAL